MTYNEAFRLFQGLSQVGDVKGNLKFSITVAKNKKKLRSELEIVEEKSKPNADFLKAFEGMTGEEIRAIKETSKDQEKLALIEMREKQVKEYQEFLDEEVSISLTKIDESVLPEELTANQLELLGDLIQWT